MSTGQQIRQVTSVGYALGTGKQRNRHKMSGEINVIKRRKEMKLTLKQRFRNWLFDEKAEESGLYVDRAVETASINSDGMRFNLYKASGGFVIETRLYDDRNDRNINKLYVITEDKDLGQELGKIITMESLR